MLIRAARYLSTPPVASCPGRPSGPVAASGQPGTVRQDDRLKAVAEVQFGEDAGDVGHHGLGAEEELSGDFSVGQALADEEGEPRARER
jgi:hypothetical protein